jgi:hypothetical protein
MAISPQVMSAPKLLATLRNGKLPTCQNKQWCKKKHELSGTTLPQFVSISLLKFLCTTSDCQTIKKKLKSNHLQLSGVPNTACSKNQSGINKKKKMKRLVES